MQKFPWFAPWASPSRDYTPTARRSRKRRRNVVILAIIAVVVMAVVLWRYLSSYESTDDAQADVHLYPVSARVSGYLVRVNVGDNQWVEKGNVPVEIDPTDYEVAVAQAQS
jgi:membrane fusion protein, multidrug efflux system